MQAVVFVHRTGGALCPASYVSPKSFAASLRVTHTPIAIGMPTASHATVTTQADEVHRLPRGPRAR